MIGAAVPRTRWRFLIQARLVAARQRLSSYLNSLQPDARAFVAPALTKRPLAQLVESLADILDDFVAPAVLEDLRRLGPSGVLYRTTFEGRSMTIHRIAAAFAETGPVADAATGVSHATACDRYLRWILGRDRWAPAARWFQAAGAPDAYVDAFFGRHPVAGYAIDLVCRHFVDNIAEACGRVLADRDALARVFFDGRPPATLARITSTGSDFHKGGHQVLILEFAGRGGPAAKIVYKPSDVEIDYLLAGRNAAIAPFLQAPPGPGYPAHVESLAERLNRICRPTNAAVAGRLWPPGPGADPNAPAARVELATYRILPRFPGSGLVPEPDGRLPIERSYGYLEFLTYEPVLKTPCPRFGIEAVVARELGSRTPPGADWVTADPAIERALFYQWGQWMVLTLVAGTSDVHVQNQRLHALKPHVIDLEESCKWSDGFKGSYISMHYDRPDEPARRTPAYALETSPNETVPVCEAWPESPSDYAKNQLYVQSAGAVRRAQPQWNDNLQCVFDGIRVAAQGIRAAEARDDVAGWLTALGQVVVRHVPEATGIFAKALRGYYANLLKIDGLAPNADAIAAALHPLAEAKAPQKVNDWLQKDPRSSPFFVLETRDNSLRDFGNFDIPYYVRRLGEHDVRNSAGRVVNVQGAWVELGRPNLAPRALPEHYFAHAAPDDFAARVTAWRELEDGAFADAIAGLVRDTFRVDMDLARRWLQPPPHPPAEPHP